ncbi:TetR/AcrR family transcriptional regulator [Cumulibacter manganitolerans]|uniref:TetR/AcrR family transcriptional regulator n=1 Tax=Cumulibacter manganitolerans TaxID=1884992 RepID=UPI001297D02E|nr:TetR/AcrR family transcriptional regulator [Cumulibacter manganitolerans]
MTEESAEVAREKLEAMTPKARRTRERLIVAARVVFERDGFLNARVVDIAGEAKVAHGTFYTYFDSKTDIFRAVVTEFSPGIYRPDTADRSLTRIQRIERGNEQFYRVYLQNLRLMALMEQAATFDEQLHAMRIQLRHRAERQILGLVKRQQQNGTLGSHLDPDMVASALVAMTTHSFYTWHVTESRDYDFDRANKTLTYLWANALGLRAEPADEEFYQSLGGAAVALPAKAASRKASARKTAAKVATSDKSPVKKSAAAPRR